jgi:threonine synthase
MITYICTTCGKVIRTDRLIYRCPDCDGKGSGGYQRGNLLVESNFSPLKISREGKDPLDPLALFPYPVDFHSSFPAGNTPLARPERLNRYLGTENLYAKCEMLNPSGSYKDRASLLVAAQAKHLGIDRIVLASTGNAGAAMSCAGAALGLEIILFVPAAAPLEKLATSVYFGARVIPVKGTYDDAFALSLEYSARYGGINRNTAFNPMTIEGKKSASIEIYNQMGGEVPDLVYIPAGDGVIYSGICKGFGDLKKLGLISKLPKCIAVQARGSNALYRSWREGREVLLDSTDTIADSLSVCSPACGEPALQFMKSCSGWAVEVTDSEIAKAQADLAREGGFFTEPSSAAALAGFMRDRDEGKINKTETAVLMLTGTGYKDMKAVLKGIRMPDPVGCSLDEVDRALGI